MTTAPLFKRCQRFLVLGVALTVPALAMTVPAGSAVAAPAVAATRVGPSVPTVRTFQQQVPVNVVLVGYDKREVGTDILGQLPRQSSPVVRYPLYYGLQGRDLGLKFSYHYRVIDTPKTFENHFFGYLKKIGTPSAPTTYQQAYNDENNNVLKVTGPVLNIDAPSTEQWLESHGRSQLGLNNHAYTVYLVNWYGRSDFAFHVYRKTDQPDPDTGVNFGADYNSRGMIAWGGSHGRSWFYDLSAGPEAWTSNWNVDDADVDGDGVADYRMPAIWEYTRGGYRSRSLLGSDLGTIVRYVAINLLFTSSPLYDPLVTAPPPGGKLSVPITMFEDDPSASGLDWVRPYSSKSEWQSLEPYHRFQAPLKDVNPIDPGARRTLRIFAGLDAGKGQCWKQYGDTFAQPYCYFNAHHGEYYPDRRKNYEAGVFAFNTTPENMGSQAGLLGFADDNWTDGTQSYVFAFDDPETRGFGYGFTTTITHEVGHHLGLSHPHDGYDPATGLDYGTVGDSYFTWVGDESDTVMQYIAVSNGFGQFDKDNMSRYWFAGYANWTADLIAAIKGSPDAGWAGREAVESAHRYLRQATSAFHDWRYLAAAGAARKAYVIAQREADALHVGQNLRPAPLRLPPNANANAPHEGDPVRFPQD